MPGGAADVGTHHCGGLFDIALLDRAYELTVLTVAADAHLRMGFLHMEHGSQGRAVERFGEHRDRGVMAGLGDSGVEFRRQLHRIRALLKGGVTTPESPRPAITPR